MGLKSSNPQLGNEVKVYSYVPALGVGSKVAEVRGSLATTNKKCDVRAFQAEPKLRTQDILQIKNGILDKHCVSGYT